MSKNFIVLSEQQTEWMRRAVKQMIELAGYYSLTKFPMDEADCDNIVNTFSSYTKKSRNNGMIIHCANALSEYLERIGNQTGKYSKLDVHQMRQIEVFADEQFVIAGKWQQTGKNTDDLQEAKRELRDCVGRYPEHELVDDLSDMFQNYLDFCLKENLGKQLLEQKQSEAEGREPPNNGRTEPERKYTKIR